MSETHPIAEESSNWIVYKRLLSYLKPLKFLFFLSIIGNAIYAAASAAMAKSMDYLVNAIQAPTEESRLFVPLLIVGVFALRGFGSFLGGYYIASVGNRVVYQMRSELFSKLLYLPCSFYDQTSSGKLVSKVTYNVQQVTGAATNAITISIREGLTVIGLLGVMVYENWKLTCIFLIAGPFIGLVVGSVSKRFRTLSRRIMDSMGGVTHVTSETVTGYRVVRLFGGIDYEKQRFDQSSANNLKQSLKMELTKAISTPVVQVLISLSIAVLVWIALSPEVQGNMTAGGFIAFITAATTMAKPVRQLTQVNAVIQQGVAAAKDLFQLIDQEQEIDKGTHISHGIRSEIEFRKVEFAYPGTQKTVLNSIDLTIPKGQTVAFVGRSGSGKSTLANLLPRFYECTKGEITIDGQDITQFSLESLRHQISLVNQHVTLFNDSIRRNIAYGELADKSDADIIDAAVKAHAWEFIEKLPQGLDTVIGDNGLLLSGGQRQRLAIARALLKDAPILILDEATSALDNESERHIQAAMENVMIGRTTLVIAHRLSTIENADKIVVLSDGNVIEEGNHQELMSLNGMYAQLQQMQFAESNETTTSG